MSDEVDREPIPDPETERLAQILEATLGEEFAGYPVRVDAGERGRVFVALAEAEGDEDALRVTSERLDDRLGRMGLDDRGIEFRMSSAESHGDLLLVCEFFAGTRDEE